MCNNKDFVGIFQIHFVNISMNNELLSVLVVQIGTKDGICNQMP